MNGYPGDLRVASACSCWCIGLKEKSVEGTDSLWNGVGCMIVIQSLRGEQRRIRRIVVKMIPGLQGQAPNSRARAKIRFC